MQEDHAEQVRGVGDAIGSRSAEQDRGDFIPTLGDTREFEDGSAPVPQERLGTVNFARGDEIAAVSQRAAAALDQVRISGNGHQGSEPLSKLLAVVEEIHRAASARNTSAGVPADVIARIERLESWVATNRLA